MKGFLETFPVCLACATIFRMSYGGIANECSTLRIRSSRRGQFSLHAEQALSLKALRLLPMLRSVLSPKGYALI